MEKLSFSIRQNFLFFAGSLLFLLVGSILLLTVGNHPSFLLLNSHHYFLLDIFFSYYTNVGNGVFAIILGLIYIFIVKRQEEGITIICSFLLSGLIAQIIKHLISFPRPKSVFGINEQHYFITGIEYAFNNSFPSGHSATAFAAATVVVLTMKNKKWQLPILLLAILVGFSRIYLGQHFLLDVIVGALIGIISGLGCVNFLRKYQLKKLNSN
jgi:membrane-associated phospholipid phosphatase